MSTNLQGTGGDPAVKARAVDTLDKCAAQLDAMASQSESSNDRTCRHCDVPSQ
jgi:hypothetical protein